MSNSSESKPTLKDLFQRMRVKSPANQPAASQTQGRHVMDTTRMKLKTKIPLAIGGVSIVVAAVLQVLSYSEMRNQAIENQESRFLLQGEALRQNVVNWVENAKLTSLQLASSPLIVRSVQPAATFTGTSAGPRVVGAPDDKSDLIRYLNAFAESAESDDIFVIDAQGVVVQSVDQKVAPGTRLLDGPLANSALAEVFTEAMASSAGEAQFADFQGYAPFNGTVSSFVGAPIINGEGSKVGVLAVHLHHDELQEYMMKGYTFGLATEAYVIGSDFSAASMPTRGEAFDLLDNMPRSEQAVAAIESNEATVIPDVRSVSDAPDADPSAYAVSVPIDLFDEHWGLVVEKGNSEIFAEVDALLTEQIFVTLAAVGITLFLGFFIGRSITQPLSRVTGAIHRIGDGALDAEVVDIDRRDELGDIAKAVERQRALLLEQRELEAERARQQEELQRVVEGMRDGMTRLASGNLSTSIDTPFAEAYEVLRENYNQTLGQLNSTISQVVEVAESIRARSSEISNASVDLSRRTENQAAALEETAAALDAMTTSVKANASGAVEVESTVKTTRSEAEESGKVVKAAVSKMTEIQRSSEKISNISGTIEDIAFQTNLLALNAGVEAARAGDAGKGFAVVASEVRALAQRSSDAAKEIKTLITSSSQHVRTGVDQVNRAGEVIENIVGRVTHISELMSGIAAGAAEQSSGLSEINIGVTQLDQVTQQNAAMVEESTAASQGLAQDATNLAGLVSHFQFRRDGVRQANRPVTAPEALGAVKTEATSAETTPVVAKLRAAIETPHGVWQDF